jgi:hypothetical protein
MRNRYDRDDWRGDDRDDYDRDERNRGEFSGGPFGRRPLGGDYARDTHRGGYGGDYAREGGWSGGGRGDEYTREGFWGGTGAPADWASSGYGGPRGSASVGYGPGQTRSTFGRGDTGGSAVSYGETDPAGRTSFRGRGPKNWRRSDERIREEINERLTDHDGIDASDIEVTVENAEVTLSGNVGSRWEKRLADDIAHSCNGVHDVHNRLKVADRETQVGKASE